MDDPAQVAEGASVVHIAGRLGGRRDHRSEAVHDCLLAKVRDSRWEADAGSENDVLALRRQGAQRKADSLGAVERVWDAEQQELYRLVTELEPAGEAARAEASGASQPVAREQAMRQALPPQALERQRQAQELELRVQPKAAEPRMR